MRTDLIPYIDEPGSMKPGQVVHIITSGGSVRRGHIEFTNVTHSFERVRESRIQYRVQIEGIGFVSAGQERPQRARWYDAACVFVDEVGAVRCSLAARQALRSGHPRYQGRPIDQIVVMTAVAPAIGAEGRA